MNATIERLEQDLLLETLKEITNRAYKQGIEDARKAQSLPPMLKKDDLAYYFQVSKASVENIIRMSGFPKSKITQARYPRDEVINWANENTERVSSLKAI